MISCFVQWWIRIEGIVIMTIIFKIMLYSNNIFEIISTEPIQDDEESLLVYKHSDIDQCKDFSWLTETATCPWPTVRDHGTVLMRNLVFPQTNRTLHAAWILLKRVFFLVTVTEERHRMADAEREKFLSLKGQMFYMEEWESICFVGIPVYVKHNGFSGKIINDSEWDISLKCINPVCSSTILHFTTRVETWYWPALNRRQNWNFFSIRYMSLRLLSPMCHFHSGGTKESQHEREHV